MLKVATINICSDTEYWNRRRDLLVAGLREINADIIGIQEIDESKADFLLTNINMPYIHRVNGVAILSRHPFIQQEIIDLQTQGKIAQFVRVEISNKQFIFCNGYYYWQPGSCRARMKQFQLLVEHLAKLPPELPIINVGDFNAMPKTPEIKFLQNHFTSAYANYHGSEPEYTCPTPLMKTRTWRQIIIKRIVNILVHRDLKPWRGTLDYIFFNHHIQVKNCQLILTQPSPEHPLIYPSDHFGIAAELEF